MMANTECVINVENLGKCYRLGQIHHNQLGELIGSGCQRVLRKFFRGIIGGTAKAKNEVLVGSSLHRYDAQTLNYVRPLHGVHKRRHFYQPHSNARKTDHFWAIRNVSFTVNRGEVIGVIGLNGAGKSTLLKILARITEPTEGRAWMKGRIASLLEVGTGFHPELTGRENIYLNGTLLGMSRTEIRRKFDEIIGFAGVERFLDTPVKRYSSGMYVRLAFAIAAHLEPEILLVDEVLAVGDAAFQHRCLGKMQQVTNEGRTILFVSHNMLTVQSLCPRTVLLKSGNVVFQGDTETAISEYLRQNALTSEFSVDLRDHKGRSNQLRAIFQSVRIFNSKREGTSTIRTGDGVIFELMLEMGDQEVLSPPAVQIELRDARGTPICQFKSPAMQPNDFHLQGRNILRCYWKSCRLVPGIYSINLEVKREGKTIDRVEHAAALEVKPSHDRGVGSIHTIRGFIIPDERWEAETVTGM